MTDTQDSQDKKPLELLIKNIIDIDHRPSWNEYFIVTSYLISKRSSCERLNVGCVIVQNNRIISTGYNGHIKGADHISHVVDGHEQMTIHAETNAVADAASRGVKLNGCTAYVTHYPCVNCAKILIAAGIKEIYFCEDYKNSPICQELYTMGNVKVNKLTI